MNKENILSITLFVSIIVLNPMMTQTLEANVNTQSHQTKRLSTEIQTILSDRGIEEEAAHDISEQFIARNHPHMERMVENILYASLAITKEELLGYLANEALFKRDISLAHYDYLIGMMSEIKKKVLDKGILKNIKTLSLSNRSLLS